MDEALAGFADRLATREGELSPQSMAAAWEQFLSDWNCGLIYENFLLDLTERINACCPELEFIDTFAKHGSVVSTSQGCNVPLGMINWNGYWDSPITIGPTLVFPSMPVQDACLTTQAFLERLPKHLDEIAGKFVSCIGKLGWTVYARLEIPEGCAPNARWAAPLRMVRQYVVDQDLFIARFDMLGGRAEGI